VQRPIRSAPFNEGVGERSAVLVLFSSTEREMGLVIRELLDWLVDKLDGPSDLRPFRTAPILCTATGPSTITVAVGLGRYLDYDFGLVAGGNLLHKGNLSCVNPRRFIPQASAPGWHG
jgi:hypothetical protein